MIIDENGEEIMLDAIEKIGEDANVPSRIACASTPTSDRDTCETCEAMRKNCEMPCAVGTQCVLWP